MRKKRYTVAVCHRGMGKSVAAVNELYYRALTCKKRGGGTYLYLAPLLNQAKGIVWPHFQYYGMGIPGIKFNNAELSISLPNGSIIRFLGVKDAPDKVRGYHPEYVILDEVADMPYNIWEEIVFPGLQINKGGALFIGTPKGENIFYDMYKRSIPDPEFFSALVNVYDSKVYPEEDIENFRGKMSDAKFCQEYMCDWFASISGYFYTDLLTKADEESRIGKYPYNPMKPVITCWDIGVADRTAIWFAQVYNGQIYVIDFLEDANKDIFHYLKLVKDKKYLYKYHILPHDATKRNLANLKSIRDIFADHGMKVLVQPRQDVMQGIQNAQGLLYRCSFDETKCKEGLVHLRNYRSKQDKVTGEYLDAPIHNETSHAADSFRYLMNWVDQNEHKMKPSAQQKEVELKQPMDNGLSRLRTPMNRYLRHAL